MAAKQLQVAFVTAAVLAFVQAPAVCMAVTIEPGAGALRGNGAPAAPVHGVDATAHEDLTAPLPRIDRAEPSSVAGFGTLPLPAVLLLGAAVGLVVLTRPIYQRA